MTATARARVMAEMRPRTGLLHLLLHRKRLLLGATIIVLFFLSAILAPVLAPSDPSTMDLSIARQPPSAQHLLGTDELGRDLLTRILYGGRVTLIIAVVALALSSLVGTTLGVAAGYAGGRWDNLLMRLIDIQLAFPGVILAIAIVAVVGPGIPALIIALALFPIPAFARLSRATTLVIMTQDYILAAHAIGVGRLRIVIRHVLPNNLGPLLVQASLTLPGIILIGSSLGFLGLGVQPPTPEWGVMLSRGRDYVVTAPHLGIFPGAAVTLVVLGFTLMGDSLRDMLDPHLRKLEA
jgi:peptide/nickel transport system permease protein